MVVMWLVVSLMVHLARHVAAQPRCRALRQYQSEPMIFQCHGASLTGRLASENTFKFMLPAGKTMKVLSVPNGTINFTITMGPEHIMQYFPAEMAFRDPASGVVITRANMTKVQLAAGNQNNKWSVTFQTPSKKNQTIDYWAYLAAPRTHQVIFHGKTPAPMDLMVKSKVKQDVVLAFTKFGYAPYQSGPMCGYGKHAVGCKYYNQALARAVVVNFCSELQKRHPKFEDGWAALKLVLDPLQSQTVAVTGAKAGAVMEDIPYYTWCRAWEMFSAYTQYCWQAYKFITHGGLEANTPSVTSKNIEFCYELPKIDTFAKECCRWITKKYRTPRIAYHDQAVWGKKHQTAKVTGSGLYDICKNCPNIPRADVPLRIRDYTDLYMDADGYQGLMAHDLDFCWRPPTLPAPTGTTAYPPVPGNGGFIGHQNSHRIMGTTTYVTPGPSTTVTEEPDIPAAWITTGGAMYTPAQQAAMKAAGQTAPTTTMVMTTRPQHHRPGALQCGFVRDPECAPNFTHDGRVVHGCASGALPDGTVSNFQWCSLDAFSNSTNRYKLCTWQCHPAFQCAYKAHAHCVSQFTIPGNTKKYGPCTDKGMPFRRWCSEDTVYKGRWRFCEWDCSCYQKPQPTCLSSFTFNGQRIYGCTDADADHYWCSTKNQLTTNELRDHPSWTVPCQKNCPECPSEAVKTPRPVETTAVTCFFVAPADCPHIWRYKGHSFNGCQKFDHIGGWCSLDADYAGRWKHCDWRCRPPPTCAFQAAPNCQVPFYYNGSARRTCVPEKTRPPWCSLDAHATQTTSCLYNCPCYWTPHWDCRASFSLEGKTFTGCTTEYSPGVAGAGWCSMDRVYQGRYRYCGWICPSQQAGAVGNAQPVGNGKFSMTSQYLQYAAIGAGVGAGVSVLGLGMYGIIEAVNSSHGSPTVTPVPALVMVTPTPAPALMAARAASMVSHKQLRHNDQQAHGETPSVPVTAVVIGVALCSFCCVIALVSVFCCRRGQKRSSESEMQLVHRAQPVDWNQQSEDNWPLIPTGSWHW